MVTEEELELLGFNSDIRLDGKMFHVQTELITDPPAPTINTSVYHLGCLIRKTTFDCAELLSGDGDLGSIKAKVQEQHAEAVSALESGALPEPH